MSPEHEKDVVLRADAAENRARLLRAAREVFAESGFSATLNNVAKRAGVGIGTVYRNFSSKHQLVEALYEQAVDETLTGVREASEISDPWQALVVFFEATAADQARDQGLVAMFLGSGDDEPLERTATRILDAVAPLFDRARDAGVLRDDVGVTDILPIFAMLDALYRLTDTAPDLWKRYLAVLLDGLRACNTPPLPHPPLSIAQFHASIGHGH